MTACRSVRVSRRFVNGLHPRGRLYERRRVARSVGCHLPAQRKGGNAKPTLKDIYVRKCGADQRAGTPGPEELRRNLAVWIKSLSGDDVLAEAENILARLVRLAQLASNPRLLDAGYSETPAKFLALDELLRSYLADPTEKAIVWTSFVGNISALLRRFERYKPVALHGEMNSANRNASVRAFKNNASVRLMIANPAAAREGLTLTQARTAIYVDRTFNQSTSCNRRIGFIAFHKLSLVRL